MPYNCITKQTDTLNKPTPSSRYIKVHSLLRDGKQTAGCTEFCTETGLRSLVSVQKFVHPAICLTSLKKEWTLVISVAVKPSITYRYWWMDTFYTVLGF